MHHIYLTVFEFGSLHLKISWKKVFFVAVLKTSYFQNNVNRQHT